MKLRLRKFEVSTGGPIIFLNVRDCKDNNIHTGDRLEVKFGKYKIIGRVDIMGDFVEKGEVGLSKDVIRYLKLEVGDIIDLKLASKPKSAAYINKKMNGKKLSKREIFEIIQDIVNNALTEAEIAQFVVAVYESGMDMNETFYLTDAMCRTGKQLKWKNKIVADKHSIGGVAGNRTTPLVVSICAAAGITMPKTSSRAITSAAGTADTVETITKVDFSSDDLKRIVEKVGACLAWGGALGLAPADDKLIKIERILKIDPEPQLLASIMSKKLSVGSTHVLIDIPYGEGAKVSKEKAVDLKNKFMAIARHFKIKMKVILTNGSEPIGNGIGPTLEMVDILKVLRREGGPKDLEQKAVMMAGIILEITGKAQKEKGERMAQEILDSKRALKKFNEIVEFQGKSKYDLSFAKRKKEVKAESNGKITHIDNKKINDTAFVLGCPVDKRAGIYLKKHVGDLVKKGETIMILYAETSGKLNEGLDFLEKNKPISY